MYKTEYERDGQIIELSMREMDRCIKLSMREMDRL